MRRHTPRTQQNVVACLTALGTLDANSVNIGFLVALQAHGERVAWQLIPHEVADILFALSKLNGTSTIDARFLDAILRRGVEEVPQGNARQVMACIRATFQAVSSNLTRNGDQAMLLAFVAALQKRGVDVCEDMRESDVASCLRFIERLDPKDIDFAFIRAIQNRGAVVASSMEARHVAACFEGICRLHVSDTSQAFLKALQRRGSCVLLNMSGSQVASSLHACLYGHHRARVADLDFVLGLQDRGTHVAGDMTAGDVAKTLYALQWLAPRAVNTAFISLIYDQGLLVAREMLADDVAHCMYAVSMDVSNGASGLCPALSGPFVDALQDAAVRSTQEGTTGVLRAVIPRMLMALSRLGDFVRSDVIGTLEARATWLVESMQTQDLVVALNAAAAMRDVIGTDIFFLNTIAQRCVECASSMDPCEIDMAARSILLLNESAHLDGRYFHAMHVVMEENAATRRRRDESWSESGPLSYAQLFENV